MSSLIAADPAAARDYTWASRVVAVVSDGTAVLGLGDIGPKASLPVMEGKSALMKAFAGLDSVPIVLSTTDPDEIVAAVTAIAPSFGAINLEDISAPRCFEVEQRLVERTGHPGDARRPARHRGGGAGRADECRIGDPAGDGRSAGGDRRRRGGRHRLRQDPARRRHPGPGRGRLQGRAVRGPGRHAPGQAEMAALQQSRAASRRSLADAHGRRRRVHRGLRRPGRSGAGLHHGPAADRLRAGQPHPGDRPGRGARERRRGGRHRAQ